MTSTSSARNYVVRAVCLLLVCLSFQPNLAVGPSKDIKHVKCEVCKATINEVKNKLDSSKKHLKDSEVHILEILDGTCEQMDDYVFAKSKKTGLVDVLKLVSIDGKMADLKDHELEKDFEENKLIHFYCDEIIGEYEEELLAVLKLAVDKNITNVDICHDVTDVCDDKVRDEL